MVAIRQEQLEEFGKDLNKDFKRRAYAHLWRIFPEQCQSMQDPGVRALVDQGIRRAVAYGMSSERQALCFIDMMFLVGRDFDSPDAGHDWAQKILTDPLTSADLKMDELYNAAGAPPPAG